MEHWPESVTIGNVQCDAFRMLITFVMASVWCVCRTFSEFLMTNERNVAKRTQSAHHLCDISMMCVQNLQWVSDDQWAPCSQGSAGWVRGHHEQDLLLLLQELLQSTHEAAGMSPPLSWLTSGLQFKIVFKPIRVISMESTMPKELLPWRDAIVTMKRLLSPWIYEKHVSVSHWDSFS